MQVKPKRYYLKPSVIVDVLKAYEDLEMKPIEAMKMTGDATADMDIFQWVEQHVGSFAPRTKYIPTEGVSVDPRTGFMLIATSKGLVQVEPEDWVIRSPKGVFSMCKGDMFFDTYYEI